MADVTVELWERDTRCAYHTVFISTSHFLVDPNDLLDSKKTSREGEFLVKGGQNEVGSIEPFLRITHTCNVKKPGCKRITEFDIPKSKIDTVYDMTYVTLDIISAVDKEKC
ncbi:Transthyretin-like family protein [Ancylostoma caninum]|uniref:Transthyretin-like family protein n=1 Tax=Ancylostoma caninum TaxID=29170 RepID=A0A368FGH3_ANCCA|nr:Transthyretin-like family protein [Ancylostoma caninum]